MRPSKISTWRKSIEYFNPAKSGPKRKILQAISFDLAFVCSPPVLVQFWQLYLCLLEMWRHYLKVLKISIFTIKLLHKVSNLDNLISVSSRCKGKLDILDFQFYFFPFLSIADHGFKTYNVFFLYYYLQFWQLYLFLLEMWR